MRSLILETRLEILSANLRDVRDVLELAKRRSEDIQALRDRLVGPTGVRAAAKELKTTVGYMTAELDDDELRGIPQVARTLEYLDLARTHLTNLTSHLDQCSKSIDTLLGSRVELSTRRIQERLPDKAEESIRELHRLLDDKRAVADAWEAETRLAAQCEPLFAEYVDLLRGLALRESGIERGICELADRLLDGCDRVAGAPWKSLAIPSYGGGNELTPAQIIRLGFPEWTIWALPLAAFDFGRLMVNQDSTLKATPEDDALAEMSDATRFNCLADAFASYAVGPAYACAVILMRLDPRPSAPGETAADDVRARVIFELLTIADANAGVGVSLSSITARLRQAWDEAVKEAGAVPGNGRAPRALAEFFWDWAERRYITAKYQPNSWHKAEKLKDILASRIDPSASPPDDNATATSGADVRDTLNAAWLFRLEQRDKATEISAAALLLWQEAQVKSQRAVRFTGPDIAQIGAKRRTI